MSAKRTNVVPESEKLLIASDLKFNKFPKIPRLRRPVIITEKIDGTNAGVHIRPLDPLLASMPDSSLNELLIDEKRVDGTWYGMFASSRSGYITPKKDNHGFAKWVQTNSDALFGLGEGSHYGELWGSGINRGYGLDAKVFSLFNIQRWHEVGTNPRRKIRLNPTLPEEYTTAAPECCAVVPVLLSEGLMGDAVVDDSLELLRNHGSVAAAGFMNPEGIVVYHVAGGLMFKVLLEKDEEPKGNVGEGYAGLKGGV